MNISIEYLVFIMFRVSPQDHALAESVWLHGLVYKAKIMKAKKVAKKEESLKSAQA